MGFRPESDVLKVEFANPTHPLHGLVMRTKMPTVGMMLDQVDSLQLLLLGSEAEERLKKGTLTAEWAASLTEQAERPFRVFAQQVIEWNMEDPDPPHDPIPPTLEGFKKLDVKLMNLIVSEWRKAVAGVGDDLKGDLSSGEISPMPDIPMEVSSPSRTS